MQISGGTNSAKRATQSKCVRRVPKIRELDALWVIHSKAPVSSARRGDFFVKSKMISAAAPLEKSSVDRFECFASTLECARIESACSVLAEWVWMLFCANETDHLWIEVSSPFETPNTQPAENTDPVPRNKPTPHLAAPTSCHCWMNENESDIPLNGVTSFLKQPYATNSLRLGKLFELNKVLLIKQFLLFQLWSV